MRKVRIKTLPKAGMGMETKNSSFFPWPVKIGTQIAEPDIQVNKTLKPVDKDIANLEAEKGETVVTDLNKDGITEHYTVGGKRHYDGGTPLNLPDNSFVFSRDNKMKIKDENILEMFGTNKNSTPADIAKKYDINTFRQILADPDTDKLQRKTAEQMIANYNLKLAKLSLAQESIKGFPNGIPQIAMPYVMATQMDPSQLLGTQGQQADPSQNTMKYGGGLEMYDFGKEVLGPGDGIDPWFSQTNKGKTTPTQQNSDAPFTAEDYDKFFKEKGINTDKMSGKQAQLELYKKADPYHKALMWGTYGDTSKGATGSKFEKYSPLPNENYADYKKRMSAKYTPEQLNKELNTYVPNFADGKNGVRTAFLFNEPNSSEAPVTPAPVVPGQPPVAPAAFVPPVQPHLAPGPDNAPPDQWWMQDIIKTSGAAMDMFRVKKYEPWQATPGVDYVDPTFYDPNREIAGINEQMRIGTAGAQIFTGPQAYNARFAQMQGQGAKNIADTMSRINNLNVGVANQTEGINTDIYNQHSNTMAGLATQLYDKHTIVNQQFDNSINMARQNLRGSFIDAITNKNETASLNELFPQFHINPLEGGRVHYTGKEKPLNANYQAQDDVMKRAQEYMNQHPGLDWKDALKAAGGPGFGGTEQDDAFEQYRKLLAAQRTQP